MPGVRGRKRSSIAPSRATPTAGKQKKDDGEPAKRTKVAVSHRSHLSSAGCVLACGAGDVGQLGLGENVFERTKPGKVELPDPVIQVVAGGMHTVCLLNNGQVYTFGCNDDGALGRDTEAVEGSETRPDKVADLPGRIVLVSAGDSHTAALTDDGIVYIWGAFRDANGMIGLLKPGNIQRSPVQILEGTTIVKIASGGDHVVCLSENGDIYTLGCAEQGQLGRVAECFSQRGGRKGLEFILTPGEVHFKRTKGAKRKFSDIWASSYYTYAQEQDTNEVFAWGLNNYFQLGIDDMMNRYMPQRVESFAAKEWVSIVGGQHHVVALDAQGKVFTLGRGTYGQLGLGEDKKEDAKAPTAVTTLNNSCTCIGAGSSVSFAVDKEGVAYGWGMGTNQQLAQTEEDDLFDPTKMTGKQLENKKVLSISSGGQHTVLLVADI